MQTGSDHFVVSGVQCDGRTKVRISITAGNMKLVAIRSLKTD